MAAGRRRATVPLIVVALVVVAVIAVVAVLATRDSGGGSQVLVVGDSVTFMSREVATEAFGWTSEVEVQGRPGYRTDQIRLLAAEQIDKVDPDFLVVFTGYNDLLQGVDTSDAVEELMDVSADFPCAVWLLLPTKGDYSPEAAEEFNQHLVDLAGDRSTVHVSTDWRDAVDAGDGPDPDPDLIAEDRIHPVPAGSLRLAQVMEESVSRECR